MFAGLLLPAGLGAQQVDLTGDYMENFDSVKDIKTANAYPWEDGATIPGWYALVNDKAAKLYRVTNGGTESISPPIWIARNGNSDGALGSVTGKKDNALLEGIFGVKLVNKTGKTITGLKIAYHGEQWSHRPGDADHLTFEYSPTATALGDADFKEVPALNFAALKTGAEKPVPLNGNDDKCSSVVKGTIEGLSIAPDASIWLRWTHHEVAGGNQGLAIDDLIVSPVTQ